MKKALFRFFQILCFILALIFLFLIVVLIVTSSGFSEYWLIYLLFFIPFIVFLLLTVVFHKMYKALNMSTALLKRKAEEINIIANQQENTKKMSEKEMVLLKPEVPDDLDGLQKQMVETITISIKSSSAPQEKLDQMKQYYTNAQMQNDLRIIQESLDIMERTRSIETFLSRHEVAMRLAYSLNQAQEAGLPVIFTDLPKLILNLKEKNIGVVLSKSFNKEMEKISKLKTPQGKLNQVSKYLELLKEYEDEFEFNEHELYSEIISNLQEFKDEFEPLI